MRHGATAPRRLRIDVLVHLAPGGIACGQRELDARVDLRLDVGEDPIQDLLVGETLCGEPVGERLERIAARHPLPLFFPGAVVAVDVADVMAVVPVGLAFQEGRPLAAPGAVLVASVPNAGHLSLVRDLVLVGLGVGVGMPLYLNATQSAVDARFLGVVSSQIQFWRNIGSTVGVALLGSVLGHELGQKIAAAVPPQLAGAVSANAGNAQAIFSPTATQGIPAPILLAIRGALAASLHDVFLIAAGVAALAVVVSLFLQEVPLRGRTPRVRQPEVETAPAFGG